MNTYISLLRGINVSGSKIILMKDLKILFEKLDFKQVTSYLQSGNVVFTASSTNIKELEKMIEKAIYDHYGYDVPTQIFTGVDLQKIIQSNPFTRQDNFDEAFIHCTFITDLTAEVDLDLVKDKLRDTERIAKIENTLYLYCPEGYGKTKLTNNLFETKYKMKATTRNWKTTKALFEITQKIDQER